MSRLGYITVFKFHMSLKRVLLGKSLPTLCTTVCAVFTSMDFQMLLVRFNPDKTPTALRAAVGSLSCMTSDMQFQIG
jgi:hypothetical protein